MPCGASFVGIWSVLGLTSVVLTASSTVIDQEPGIYVVQSPLLLLIVLSVLASVRSAVRVWKDIVMSDALSVIGSALCGFVEKEF